MLRRALLVAASTLLLLAPTDATSAAAGSRPALVASWSVQDVGSWLESLGLGEYVAAIERELVDGEALFELTPNDWRTFLGVDKLGHRVKIDKALKKLIAGKPTETIPEQAAAPVTPVTVPQPVVAPPAATPPPPTAPPTKKQPPVASKKLPPPRKHPRSVLSSEAATVLLKGHVSLPAARKLSAADEHSSAEFVRLAVDAHQRLDYGAAKSLYMRALALSPRNPRALHMLSLIAMQHENDHERALELIKQSLSLAPEAETFINLGNMHWSQGPSGVELALIAWSKALETGALAGGPPLRLRFAETLYNEALRVYQADNPALSTEYLEAVVVLANEALYLHFPPEYAPPMSARMAADYKRGGHTADQDASDERLTGVAPAALLARNAGIHHALRLVLADALLHLGVVHQQSEQSAPLALAYYARCLDVQPNHLDTSKPDSTRIATVRAEATENVQRLRWMVGDAKLKSNEFTNAMREATAHVMTHQVSQSPGSTLITPSLARTRSKRLIEFLHKTCKTSEAFELAQLIADDSTFHSPRYPHLYADAAEIVQTRADFEARLDHLLVDPEFVNRWPLGAGLEWNRFRFYLAYHGLNNAPILKKLAQVYQRGTPVLTYTSPHLLDDPTNGLAKRLQTGRIKVAFISAFLTNHPVGKTLQGYIYHLPRERFEIIIYYIALQGDLGPDAVHEGIRERADAFHTLKPEDWPQIRATIDQDRPDVLVYGDIGMEPTSYFLSFSRLAPIQAMTFGHPDTSGVPNMDYFLSHRGMDADNDEEAQSFYTERLVRLPGIGYWHRAQLPPTPAPLDRAFYGVSDADLLAAGVDFPDDSGRDTLITSQSGSRFTMYLVTKAVQFFSPDFMDVLAGVLHQHPRSFLALVMETGKSKGFDVHNACIDHVYDGIEARLRKLRAASGDQVLDQAQEKVAQTAEATRRTQRHPRLTSSPFGNDVLGRLVSSKSAPPLRPGVSGRVRFIDRGDHNYFLHLLSLADVLLQPMPLDGTTTTLEAISVGTPTVVHRGPMVGGRMASAIYQHAGLTDTVATTIEEYVTIAVRLGTDQAFAKSVREKLRAVAADTASSRRVFEDPSAIDAYAAWIEHAVAEKAAT